MPSVQPFFMPELNESTKFCFATSLNEPQYKILLFGGIFNWCHT